MIVEVFYSFHHKNLYCILQIWCRGFLFQIWCRGLLSFLFFSLWESILQIWYWGFLFQIWCKWLFFWIFHYNLKLRIYVGPNIRFAPARCRASLSLGGTHKLCPRNQRIYNLRMWGRDKRKFYICWPILNILYQL